MNTAFRESFDADLSAITDAALLRRIRKVIEQVEAARTFQPEFRSGISALAECGRPGRSNLGWTGDWQIFHGLKIAKLLRPRTGALRGSLVRPAIVGNFGIRNLPLLPLTEMPRDATEKVIAEAAKRKANHEPH